MGPGRNKTRIYGTHQSDFFARRCQTSQTHSCRHFSSPIASTPDSHWISALVFIDLHGQNVKANKPPALTRAPGIHSIEVDAAAGVTSTRPFARNSILRGTGMPSRARQIRQRTPKRIAIIGRASQENGSENLNHQLLPSNKLESAEIPMATANNRCANWERSGTTESSIPEISAGFTRQPYQTRASTKEPFVPPKPNEFFRATLITRSRASLAQ